MRSQITKKSFFSSSSFILIFTQVNSYSSCSKPSVGGHAKRTDLRNSNICLMQVKPKLNPEVQIQQMINEF